jgi:glucosamine--fructose-6-phosphate aminotransferase (isomerizing)
MGKISTTKDTTLALRLEPHASAGEYTKEGTHAICKGQIVVNKLWNDILLQPQNLAAVVKHLYGPERERLETTARFLANDRPIILAGLASAAYLCHPAETYLNARGRLASVVYGADALYTHLPALKNANVILNTRSGETAEIVRLAQALVERDVPFVAITNEPESRTARLATHILWTNTHKDDLVSINVVTGMMTATLALAAAILGELEARRDSFESLPDQMDSVLAESIQRSDEIYQLFAKIRPIHLLYRGALKGAAYNARLVFEEVARTPAVPVEAAEFRQGPNEVVDERFGALVFVPDGQPGTLNLSLVKDIRRSRGRALTIGQASDISISNVPDELLSIPAILPAQVLAYKLAEAQGYEPGTARYITKVITAEEGIPNETY